NLNLSGVSLPIAPGTFLAGQNTIAAGSNLCISPFVFKNGMIATGSAIGSGEGACLQILSPLVVHGPANAEDHPSVLPQPTSQTHGLYRHFRYRLGVFVQC